MARRDTSAAIADVIGQDVVRIVRLGNGWPSIYEVTTATGLVPVAAHVTVASPHSRRDYEWRIQNPAASPPIIDPDGSLPMMIGLDTSGAKPVLVAIDGRSRLSRATRFSILFNHRISREALDSGWSEYEAGNGQRVYALQPRLFPLLVEMIAAGVDVPTRHITAAAVASGLVTEGNEESGERARRSASVYVRDARFSKEVREAYEHRCAMCGIRLGLVAGAHIYPVSAPRSPDRVWNGIALCHNHHGAFDAFRILVRRDYSIQIDPSYGDEATGDAESSRFLTDTRANLLVPLREDQRPRLDMLAARYEYYQEQYEWAG